MRARPTKHFTPKNNWINDPNGLIYHNGEYHLFYQHNPFENKWGHMSWGHAVSIDLINWQELPVAIPEQPDHAIFSGSSVFDEENSRLVAIYTGNSEGNQCQFISYSYDDGRTWQEHIKVLDENRSEFRDPKVFRYNNKWIMVLVVSNEFKAHFYESTDLLSWKFLSKFSDPDVSILWECPDLFELDGQWVFLLSTNPGGAAGGSGMYYWLGEFDGVTFTKSTKAEFLDLGPDFYAGVTFNNSEKRILIGWMNNWQYANNLVRETWNGQMSIPRELKIENGKLIQRFIESSEKFAIPENCSAFEFVYENGKLKFTREQDSLLIDRLQLWDSSIDKFTVPAKGQLLIEAVFDAGGIELLINDRSVTASLKVGNEKPEIERN
jgi:fructan beta-fructosidase